jgi:PPOX class probable F420-dependent enzyme
MPIALPESLRKVLIDKAYGHVITFNADGSPQVTMVWMDAEGNQPQYNTADGRIKVTNLRKNPKIMVSVQDRNNPQSYALIKGTATITAAGAEEHIDRMAQRFLGMDKYPWRAPGEKRLLVKIDIEKITGFAPMMQPWK